VKAYSQTATETAFSRAAEEGESEPGVVIAFSSGHALLGPIAQAGELVLGRGEIRGVELRDSCMSRRHVTVKYGRGKWTVTDQASRNGSYVNGERVEGSVHVEGEAVLRTGETVSLLLRDVRPFLEHHIDLKGDYIVGPRLEPALSQVRRAANSGAVHITGETGSGKEIAAKHFHRFGPGRDGPFVAVNCAAIPEGVAERLLFGATKGAYSGADKDARGYVQEANGGTLFLDEVGELPPGVQAKLLRVLETREVIPLGASRPVKVEFGLCSATHRDLREFVSQGKFREDLFYRLGRPHVVLPPLRERREEIPFLIERHLHATCPDLVPHATLVEACMLKYWPGNVRELLAEVRDAAFNAQAQGKNAVRAFNLAEDAGLEHSSAESSAPGSSQSSNLPPDHDIQGALAQSQGKVATAARALGIHRNQLRRWLEKNGIDPKQFGQSKV
jgi:transcriptional regulator with PAS, ATPase and Fis domain